ncbi:Centromere protein N [Hondaea fermentalgiana]|uniref:Centromere protein N n=1 Tax=Hondaea fermentalgiana TaxID=2315210 RepID=A0A2R5GDJ6_9STRA|nr:Centromere protein N [Hondaea fermentalgiana]|eukprot:GBG26271.1 Centromere protein N [Hondaea fermentalgiana]
MPRRSAHGRGHVATRGQGNSGGASNGGTGDGGRGGATTKVVNVGRVRSLADLLEDPGRRNWSVYRLQGVRRTGLRDPESFGEALREAIAPFFSLSVEAVEFKESLWVQLKGKTGMQLLTAENVFLVYPPHSKFLFVTPFRSKDAVPIFCQALCNVFQCANVDELALFGKDITTLKDLALRKLSQGAFSAYRLCAAVFDYDPLQDQQSLAKRRRAVIDKVLDEEQARSNADQARGKDRNQVIRKTAARAPARRFTCPTGSGTKGDEEANLGLRTVCLKARDDLRSSDGARTDVENLQCYIRLEGSNVLRGLEALYENDLVVEGQEVPAIFDTADLLAQGDGDYVDSLDDSSSPAKRRRTSTRLLWARGAAQ